MVELSTKPYMIRAIFEWCADCTCGRVGRNAASGAGEWQSALPQAQHG